MKRTKERNVNVVYTVTTLLMLAIAFGFVYIVGPGITGAAVLDTGAIISATSTLEEQVNVSSMRVTGSFSGNGNATLYLGEKIVLDSRLLNATSFESYCAETCIDVDGSVSLHAVVEGDALLVVTYFNYTTDTNEESEVSVPEESANETVVFLPINETVDDTNQTNLTYNQTDGGNQTNATNENNETNETVTSLDDVTIQAFNGCTADTTNGRWTVSSSTTITTNQTCYVIIVNNSATLTVNSNYSNVTIKIEATNITIVSGASISANGLGYTGGSTTPSNGAGPGGGEAGVNDPCCEHGAGAGHGGFGGGSSGGKKGGIAYGSISNPRALGSGGGGATELGGNGGGAIFLNATGLLNNSGTVSANGNNAGGTRSGGGSGGSILVSADTFAGSGSFTAKGGDIVNALSGSGAGGRIAIYYTSKTFTGTYSVQGQGSGTPARDAASGTIFLKSRSTSLAELIFDTPEQTTINNIPVNSSLGFDPETTDIIIKSGAIVNQTGPFNATSLRNLTVIGTFELSTAYIFNTSMNALIIGTLSHKANNETSIYNISITLNNLTIPSGGVISGAGRGFQAGVGLQNGSGPGGGGRGIDSPCCTHSAGAGYGGAGGNDNSNTALSGKPYGSISRPLELGSGGGSIASSGRGGSGGGLIFLNASVLNNSGTISAAAANNADSRGGGGSGGSIYIMANTLRGTGAFTARGGDSGFDTLSGAGGGGRISINYNTSTAAFTYNVGPGSNTVAGSAGTLFVCKTFGNVSCPGIGNGVDMSFYFSINNSVQINRTITNWSSALIVWNDTSTNTTNIGFYNFTGLQALNTYKITNNSIQHATSTSSSAGTLVTFNIALNNQKEIQVRANSAPELQVDVPNQTITQASFTLINLSEYMTDADGDNITFNISERSSTRINYTFYWNGTVRIEPDDDFFGVGWVKFGADDKRNATLISNNVSVTVNSIIPPLIFNLTPSNRLLNKSAIEISVNVTDDNVSVVIANMTYPNQTRTQLILSQTVNTNTYSISYTLPVAGSYVIQFVANDTLNNRNSSTSTFTVDLNFTTVVNVTSQQYGLLGGVLNNTELNDTTSDFIQLNDSDALQELPNNQFNESAYKFGGIDMNGNVLLFHLNNDSANGENTTTPRDWSRMRINGTWFNGGASGHPGKLGAQSGTFDGSNDYIRVPDNASIDFIDNSTYTILAWVNMSVYMGASSWRGIVDKEATVSTKRQGYNFILSNQSNQIQLASERFVNGVGASAQYNFPNGAFALNTWYLLGVTYNGSHLALYSNGVNVSRAATLNSSLIDTTTVLSVGARNQGAAGTIFQGSIDEVSVWNRSLSDDEIQNIYNRQKGQFIDKGQYESQIFDAGGQTNYTNISWYNRTAVTSVNLTYIPEVRSCDDASCAGESYTSLGPRTGKQTLLPTNASRFFQYRFKFVTNDSDYSPHLYNVTIEAGEIPRNRVPRINVTLNMTNILLNNSKQNLTLYINGSDEDRDRVKNITNWFRNGTSITVLNMPFERVNNTDTDNAWDYSGYGNNGSENGVYWNASGGYDGRGAYEFDGIDDFVNVSDTLLPENNDFTISAWFRTISNSEQNIISNNGGSQAGDFDFKSASLSGGTYRIFVFLRNSSGNLATHGTTQSNDGRWHHAVLTRDVNTFSLYFDGQFESSGSNGASLTVTRDLKIGSNVGGNQKHNGTIDDVMIFNRSLSAEQILALFNNRTDLIVNNETQLHDVWHAVVVPNDGVEDGPYVRTNNVTIIATVPSVTAPIIYPADIYTYSNLTANTTYTDADGDVGQVEFRWYINNTNRLNFTQTLVASGALVTAYLNSGNLTKHDRINVSVYASDGTENSTPIYSTTVVVYNTAPERNGTVPNQTFAEDTTAWINLSDYFRDPDGDTLTFNISERSSTNVSYTFYGNGSVLIQPASSFTGLEWIFFGAQDTANGSTISSNVSINITNVFDSLTIHNQFVYPDTKIRTTPLFIDINASNIESNATTQLTCNLTGNFTGTSNKTSGSGVLLNFSIGTLDPGTYFYNATCYDSYNITTRQFNFSVANATNPDLRMVAGFVVISNDRPEVNETITVYGEVENLGTETATNVLVRIRHGEKDVCNGTISSLPGLESRASISSCNYAFPASGVQIFSISADPENAITETDETNNEATRSLLVGTVITATIGMNASINVTQGEGRTSYAVASLYTNEQFFVNGTAWYTSGSQPAPGATVNIQFTGTGTVVSTKTLSYSSFTSQSFTTGSTSGNFTVNLTVTDGLLVGYANYSLEVKSRPAAGSVPGASCPDLFPDAELFVESDNIAGSQCIEGVACALTFTIRNSGCPDVNYTHIVVNETSARSFNLTEPKTIHGERTNTTSISWIPPYAGVFTFIVDIDPRNNITESNENNRYTTSITITAAQPDLIPNSYGKIPITGPYRANETETYELRIDNNGGVATSGSYTTNMVVDNVVVTQNSTATEIAAFGGFTTIRFAHLLADPNQHNITFVVDSTNTQTEIIEANNNLSTTVTAASSADLEIREIAIQNSTRVLFNQFVYVNATFRNIGNKNITSSNFNVTFYYIGNPSNASMRLNITNFSTANVGQNISILNVSINVTNATGGSVTIEVCVDPEDVINESGFGGVNCASLGFSVYNGTNVRANSISTTPARGFYFIKEPVNFFIALSNEGVTAVGNLSIGVNITQNGTSLLVNLTNISANIGEFGGSATTNFTYMPVQHGAIFFNVKTDYVGQFAESNEGDNVINTTVYVYYPDVRVTSSDITINDSLPYINETVQVTILVHDDSPFKASNVSVNMSTNGIQLNISNVTQIPSSSADSVRFNFTPNVSGVYVLRFQVWDNLTQHTHGNQNNDIASQSIYVRNSAGPGLATSNLTVNYPNGNETVSGTISISTYVYDEDGSTDGGVVRFYFTQDNVTRTLIGSTNTSTGDHFSIGGPGALYSVSWDTTAVANGDYWLFSDAAIALSNNDSSDRMFTISNTGSSNNGGAGDSEGGGGFSGEGGIGQDFDLSDDTTEETKEASDDAFSAQPIKEVEVEFTNTGSETIRDLKIGVGMTPEEVEVVVYDLEVIEKDLAKFASDVIDALNECENASDETVNEIQRQTLEIKNKFDKLKTNLLNAFKAGAITSQAEVDALNAQIQEVKDLFDTFNKTLRDSYESGKLCEISELFELNLLLTKIIDGFELLKADVLKALKVSVLGNAENYLPLYPNKAITTCVGAFEVTLLPVSDRLLTPQLLEPIVVDEIKPGETIKRNISIKLPITARTNISIDVIYSAYGAELDRETLTFNLTPKIAASAVHVDNGVVDLYAVVSDLPGELETTQGSALPVDQKQAPLPNQLDPYIAEEITMEILVIKNATSKYKPTLKLFGLLESLINGPQTPFIEVLGPYPLKQGERVLLAQQFRYDPEFVGTYELEFNFRRGNEFVARQKHPLPLDCADGQCGSRCTVPQQDSLLLTRYLLIWMIIFLIIAMLIIFILTRRRDQKVVFIQKENTRFEQWRKMLGEKNVRKNEHNFKPFFNWEKIISKESISKNKLHVSPFEQWNELITSDVQIQRAEVLKTSNHREYFGTWQSLIHTSDSKKVMPVIEVNLERLPHDANIQLPKDEQKSQRWTLPKARARTADRELPDGLKKYFEKMDQTWKKLEKLEVK